MTSELKVDKITPASGTNTQIGEAGDTTNLSAGTVTLPTSIITGATEKTTLVDADKFLIADSADSNAFKHVQKSNLGGGTLEQVGSAFFESTQSSDTITLSNCFSNDYDHYVLYMYLLPDTNNVNINMDVASSGGNYQSNFNNVSFFNQSDGTSGSNNGEGQSSVTLGTASDNARDGGLQGVLHFHTNNNHSSLSNSGSFHCQGYYKSLRFNNDQTVRVYTHGSYFRDTGNNNVPINLLFSPSSGNWSQANLKMFGVKGSNS
jgi:hypothetical protein